MWRADMVVGAPSHSISERLSATPDPALPRAARRWALSRLIR